MKHSRVLVIILAFLFISIVGTARAQVKSVEMKMAGYLCGN
jgi:hypothetical protein